MAEDSESKAGLTEIPAQEILDKIQKGEPVKYDRVRIVGDLDLSKLNLPKERVERTEYQQRAMNLPEECKIISSPISITRSKFESTVNFSNCILEGIASFEGASFSRDASFEGASFSRDASFEGASFSGYAWFEGASFSGYAWFGGASFSGAAWFEGASFSRDAWFDIASFTKAAWFGGASFSGDAWFDIASFSGDASFEGASFSKVARFGGASFSGEILTFRNADFADPTSQEYACRKAKNLLEKNGDREEAGYHFYHEMEGKRRQKQWYYRYPEFVFVQLIFGYGVHPFRLMLCWFLVATIFAIFYSSRGGIISKLPVSSLPQPLSYFVECFYFSIVTAVTPGYGKYELTSWVYQVVASIEAIFGTFMWAAFIATFARKYMR